MESEEQNIIIYNTANGKAAVSLYARDGSAWMSQAQLAELFDTSKQNIGQHISNALANKELNENSVVKNYFTTASDGKQCEVTFYSFDMILAIGFRVRSKRGTQFRIWANNHLREYLVKGFVMDDEREVYGAHGQQCKAVVEAGLFDLGELGRWRLGSGRREGGPIWKD